MREDELLPRWEEFNTLHSEAVTGSAPNATTTYGYDNNRTSKTVTGSGATALTYSYNNSLNQLSSYTDGTRSVSLTYDLDGNRTGRTVTGGADKGTDTYSYDFENRLVSLTKGTTGSAGTYNYTYDYRTRRVVRDESQANGAVTDLIYSGGTSVQEYSGSVATANLQVEYLRGSDYGGGVGGILYSLRGGTPSYTHENKRGDVVAKTSASGALTYQAQYEGFGNQVSTSGSTLDRQKSNSKDTDPTNLIDEGMRYRDLDTGMFITRDPAGFVDGPNLYSYVIQNPWTKFDPEGLDEQTANALNNDAATNQKQADQHFQQSTNEPLRTSINSENDEFFHMVGDILSSAWHSLTAKKDRTEAALVKNDPNPGVSAKTALVSSAYAVADSDPVGSNLYKAGEGFLGSSYFEPSTGKLQLDTPQQAAGHLETAGLSFGLELGTAYLGGEMLAGLKAPAPLADGSFSISNWKGYPDFLPQADRPIPSSRG